jgi:pyruvate,orthophosphate dikinase
MTEAAPGFFAITRDRPMPDTNVDAVGNKAWNLMRLAAAGMAVPPAFVLPAEWSHRPVDANDAALQRTLAEGLARLEAATGLGFGSPRRPLLVSVRSGAAVSMPGMLETVLNIGLNRVTVEGMIRLTGNPRLAWDSYRRLIENFAEVVAGFAVAPFAAIRARIVRDAGVASERALDYRALRAMSHAMLECYHGLAGHSFPDDPAVQIASATASVFGS